MSLEMQLACVKNIILKKVSKKELLSKLRSFDVSCVILFPTNIDLNEDWGTYVKFAKNKFPLVPWVIILDSPDIENARMCGTWNVEKVLCKNDLFEIDDHLNNLVQKNGLKVILKEVGIDIYKKQFSALLKDALKVIEMNYVNLMTVRDIADIIKISESGLIREFQNYNIFSPKQLLLLLKVKHAVKLMKNEGLSLTEIAYKSGFTNPKRMIECFQRTYDLSPGKFRQKYLAE